MISMRWIQFPLIVCALLQWAVLPVHTKPPVESRQQIEQSLDDESSFLFPNQDRVEGRIVNGEEALMHQFPFQIAIEEGANGIVCSGSLISASTVLTAAHCFFDKSNNLQPLSLFTLHGGEHNFVKKEGTEQVRKIKKLTVHMKYDIWKDTNDIALIQVDSPFELGKAVKTIELANCYSNYTSSCTVSGWGYIYPRKPHEGGYILGGFPDTLRVVDVEIIDKELCKHLHKKLKRLSYAAAHPSVICAGVLAGGKDACVADSGGPLVCKGEDGKTPFVVGIVSAGIGCAQKDVPGIYADVAKMESWIAENFVPGEDSEEYEYETE